MEPVFHLPYAEFETIEQFGQVFTKRDGFGLFIPVSRQQQGIDFIVVSTRSARTLRVQVKSSRAYWWDKPPHHRFWYNNFADRYRRGAADLWAFAAVYPGDEAGRGLRRRAHVWQTSVLVFTDREIARLLPKIKGKSGKVDRFLQFGFDAGTPVAVTRGRLEGLDLTPYLLEKRVRELRGLIK